MSDNQNRLGNQSSVEKECLPQLSNNSLFTMRKVMVWYLLVFLLLLTLGSVLQGLNFEVGMLITQWILIFLPALFFLKHYKLDVVSFARLQSLPAKFLPTILLLAASFWLLNMVLSVGLVEMLGRWGYRPIELLPPPEDFGHYLIYLFLIAISAGICEEFFFRGTIMPAMEERGRVAALVYSSLLFAIFHISFLRLGPTFILGLVMGIIVIKTGSLWGGIIYHGVNNFIAVTYMYLATFIDTNQTAEEIPAEAGAAMFWMMLPVLLLSLLGVYLGLVILHRQSDGPPLLPNRGNWLPRGWFNWILVISLVLFLLMAWLELAMGFNWLGLQT